MTIIDVHAHPVARNMFLDGRNLRFIESERGALLGTSPVRTLLDRMDAGGISRACLMGPNPYEGTALTNEMVRETIALHPDRFLGFAGVDPSSQGGSMTRSVIERAVDEWGFRGVGEIGGCDFLASEWDAVWEMCLDKDVPALVHMGIPLPSMLMKYGHPFLLDELANRYPDLKIIAAHAGVPWIVETIAVAARHANVFLDISTLPAVRPFVVRLVLALCAERLLEDRVLFGSDFPVVDPCEYANSVRGARIPLPLRWFTGLPKISSAFKRKVLGENAERLLRL